MQTIRKVCVAATVALACSFANSVEAAEFRLIKLGGAYLKWGQPQLGQGAVVTYSFVQRDMRFAKARNCGGMRNFDGLNEKSDIPQRVVEREFAAATRGWQETANIRFRHVDDASRAQLLIGTQMVPRGRAFANVDFKSRRTSAALGSDDRIPPATARAFRLKPLPLASMTRALICLNPDEIWKVGFDGDEGRYDLQYTFRHELGHVLGLNHAGTTGNLMSFKYQEGSRRFSPGDVAGAQLLYGLPPSRTER